MFVKRLIVIFIFLLPHNYAASKVSENSSHSIQKHFGNILSVDASTIIDPSKNRYDSLEIQKLSPGEFKSIETHLTVLPKFPNNSYSGCHARAHFDYLKLSKLAPSKLYKVWLFSGSLLSPSFTGAISYTNANGRTATWDYHVATAFIDKNGQELVVDRLISPKPIYLSNWLENFDVEGYAILTRVSPELYLFNKTQVPPLDPIKHPNGFLDHYVAKNVFNGTFYSYTDTAKTNHWGASDIAIDALSEAFQNGKFPNCEWGELASQSLALKSEVLKSESPVGCMEASSFFNKNFSEWVTLGL